MFQVKARILNGNLRIRALTWNNTKTYLKYNEKIGFPSKFFGFFLAIVYIRKLKSVSSICMCEWTIVNATYSTNDKYKVNHYHLSRQEDKPKQNRIQIATAFAAVTLSQNCNKVSASTSQAGPGTKGNKSWNWLFENRWGRVNPTANAFTFPRNSH